MCKKSAQKGKCNGFTLVELLVVIVIMGILSAMGVAGLQGAVENNRVRDAAVNTASFLERVAADANRMSTTLCLVKKSDRRLEVHAAANCASIPEGSTPSSYFEIEAPMKFVDTCLDFGDLCEESGDDCGSSWLSGNRGVFKPKLGLSAMPTSGFVCSQYGANSHYAVALKRKLVNQVKAYTGDDEGWD